MEEQKEEKCMLQNKLRMSDWNITPYLQVGFMRDQPRILRER